VDELSSGSRMFLALGMDRLVECFAEWACEEESQGRIDIGCVGNSDGARRFSCSNCVVRLISPGNDMSPRVSSRNGVDI
jgi:hypothetical protein